MKGGLTDVAEILSKQLGKKSEFEGAIKKLISLVQVEYASATIDEQKAIFKAVSRAATLLQTRYTTASFWSAGLRLFQVTEKLVQMPEESRQLQTIIAKAIDVIGEKDENATRAETETAMNFHSGAPSSFLFEGQLSSPAPARPQWLVFQEAVLSSMARVQAEADALDRQDSPDRTGQPQARLSDILQPLAPTEDSPMMGITVQQDEETRGAPSTLVEEDSQVASIGERPEENTAPSEAAEGEERNVREGNESGSVSDLRRLAPEPSSGAENQGRQVAEETERNYHLIRYQAELFAGLHQEYIPGLQEALDATMQVTTPQGAPPASKKVVEKLPRTEIDSAVLSRLGESVCSVCRESLVIGDQMQEMPCQHYFHPQCLKPWLEMHNSCPICRHELPTDDQSYETRKEREKEELEERKGVANALQHGEFMYT